ncbi:MAG: MaoC family dehydratase N-terminal domain-containing protein [Chloroflexi bacterium]|nr:MaoC family dehydratase N-terminal domain-containing protein [Chloroflexota bacterium]
MTDLTLPRGRYFEEFEIGDEIETVARTITEADVVLFAGLSGDYNQLHTDAEFAKGTLFGERIAHGLLGLSIASGLVSRQGFVEGTIEAFTALEWKFRAPIKIGDTVHVHASVRRKKEMPRLGGGFITFDVRLLNQRDETAQKGTWTVLIKSAP